MVNLYAIAKYNNLYGRISIKIADNEVFSLNFKQLICLIKKFGLSLRFYIGNIF